MTNDQQDAEPSPSNQKLTIDRIKAKITGEKYILPHEFGPSEPATTTICVLTLQNGFTVVGKSACAEPANFNRELGQKIAYDDAVRQIWALEGYLLKERLYQKQQPQTQEAAA